MIDSIILFMLCDWLKLLSYNLVLECTLIILVALYSCLVSTELLSSLYSDVLLVYVKTSSNESLSELSCCY